ncbi:MAG: Uma2 family endonuclease [Synechococcaceae cyanobacterium SM2_3_2]|nr:Uma2 family endonuclease [Synechococcaceae cyanobacterium SM2_3_2]
MTLAARLDPQIKRYTFEEFHRLIESGQLEESNQLELIDGILVQKMTKGKKHAAYRSRLYRLLVGVVQDQAIVRTQDPIQLPPNHEPEPDFAIVQFQTEEYRSGHPRPKDIYLVIEVADSSLAYDQGVKLELYAKAGIPEYWIFNLQDNCLEVYSQPQELGMYEKKDIFTHENTIGIPEILGGELSLDQVFSLG